ncbi:protein Peter pan-like isoform X1 [Gordionus sp. m RMFG-2023]|uniref:protein Peter pan-like isoform X1 n=1 Tax=Gordionus sp. m RMFG-2023 TaxID=3053472 RepID=UPI0031FC4B33
MGKKRKKGKCAKNAQNSEGGTYIEEENVIHAPHVLIINRGHLPSRLMELIKNTRSIFEPYTSSKLKVRSSNTFKDFVSIAGTFHIHHIISFSMTETAYNMRICRVPHGPTLFFKLIGATLAREVDQLIRKPIKNKALFSDHPLLIMSGFNKLDMHHKILSNTFQNMIPSIDIIKVNLNKIKRCLLIRYDTKNDVIDIRHYAIKVNPCGINKGLTKIVKGKKVPNMSDFNDIHDYVTRDQVSESEIEIDGPENQIVLPQNISGKGNIKSHQSAIRLVEMGPRISLKLIKIEDGLCQGKVIYHHYIKKSPDELSRLEEIHRKKRKLKLLKTNNKLKLKRKIGSKKNSSFNSAKKRKKEIGIP